MEVTELLLDAKHVEWNKSQQIIINSPLHFWLNTVEAVFFIFTITKKRCSIFTFISTTKAIFFSAKFPISWLKKKVDCRM